MTPRDAAPRSSLPDGNAVPFAAAAALAGHLGAGAVELAPMGWGDSASTYRAAATDPDGTAVAARILRGAEAIERARAVVARAGSFRRAGIRVPHPATIVEADDDLAWLVTPWVDGVVGATSLQDPDAAIRLAEAMGGLASRIWAVPADGARSSWTDPTALAAAAPRWLDGLAGDLAGPEIARARDALERVLAAWGESNAWGMGMSHGDFAPINVIVEPTGSLVLLDLDDVLAGPRVLDVAWWGWVLRHHHPEVWSRTWPSFVVAAGLEPGPRLDEVARATAALRLVERAATSPTHETRQRWLGRLIADGRSA